MNKKPWKPTPKQLIYGKQCLRDSLKVIIFMFLAVMLNNLMMIGQELSNPWILLPIIPLAIFSVNIFTPRNSILGITIMMIILFSLTGQSKLVPIIDMTLLFALSLMLIKFLIGIDFKLVVTKTPWFKK